MKRLNYLLCAFSLLLSIGASVHVRAETILPPTLVIDEIQTNGAGSGTTLQEFIELANLSSTPLLIAAWELRYTNSSGNEYLLYKFPELTTIDPTQKIVFVPTTAPVDFLATVMPKISYTPPTSPGIAASSGTVSLISNLGIKTDNVSWANTAAAATGEVIQYSGGGKSIQRKVASGAIVASGLNKNDFEILDVPTPEVGTTLPLPEPPLEEDEPPLEPEVPPVETPPQEPPVVEVPIVEPTETPPSATEPVAKVYEPILINELYIDPVSPETDANNEWIELYNPNQSAVDISGYVLAAGATYSYRHVFASGMSIPANGYIVVSSANTTIALSNGGGAAKISDPDGVVFDSTVYADAPAGQAWAKNNIGIWEWTTTPTNSVENSITAPLPPVIKAAAVKAAKAKKTKAASSKKTTVKAAKTKATKAKTVKASTFDEPALIAAPTPIPGWLLAVLVSLALLYVGYEYRFEARNTIYKFRNYRSTRR